MAAELELQEGIEALQGLGLTWRKLFPMTPGGNENDRLSPLEMTLLGYLLRQGPQSPSELSDALGVARPNMSLVLKGLASRSFVEQERQAGDKRRILVRIAAPGIQAHDAMRRAHIERVSGLLSALDSQELAEMASAARRIKTILDPHLGLSDSPLCPCPGGTGEV